MQKLRASAAGTYTYRLLPNFFASASRPASQSPPSVAGRMIGASRSCVQKSVPILADIACWDLRPQVSSRNLADPPAATEAIGRCEAPGRHSDGSASPPPDSAPLWSYSCDGMRCECMCVCAAVQVAPIFRIPPRRPCDLSGASLTTRTRRLHAVSTWRGSHNGTSLPCAQIVPSNLSRSEGNRASSCAHTRLALRAASAGRFG